MRNLIKCTECGSTNIYHSKDRGELICKDCGLVVEENLTDFGKEWTEFDDGDSNKRRTGPIASELEVDRGLMTSFDLKNISKKDFWKWHRLKRWQYRMTVGIERNLDLAFNELKNLSSSIKATKSVEEEAARIYRMMVHKGLVRGRKIEKMVIGALYASLRINNNPRSLQELEMVSGISKKEIARAYRTIVKVCELKISTIDPRDFIGRICTDLNLSPKVESRALELSAKMAEKELLSGRSPLSIAAACVYIATIESPDEKKTQRAVADAAGVTEVTIRNRYIEIIEYAAEAPYKKYRLKPPKIINNNNKWRRFRR